MKHVLLTVFVVTLLLTACSPGGSGEGIEVSDAWSRPALDGQNGAVYLVIRNRSAELQEMTAAAAEVADAVEIHASQRNGDVVQMIHLESLTLEPGSETRFEPGGLHLMLVGLQRDLQAGDTIELTLQFKNHPEISVQVPVQETPE